MARPPSGSGGSSGMTAACTSRATGTGRLSAAVCGAPGGEGAVDRRRAAPGWRSTAGISVPKAARAAALARRGLAVLAQHQQRVGQRLDDGLVGAQQAADLGGAGGQAAGQALDGAGDPFQRRQQGTAGAWPGGPRLPASLPARRGAAWRPAARGRGAARRRAPARPSRVAAIAASAGPRRRRPAASQQRRAPPRARRRSRRPPRAAPRCASAACLRCRGRSTVAGRRLDDGRRRRASIWNSARPRRTVPSVCSASRPSTPAKPSGWQSEATEKPPPWASTRPMAAASKAKSASAGRRGAVLGRIGLLEARAGGRVGGGIPGAGRVRRRSAPPGAAHSAGPITCTVGRVDVVVGQEAGQPGQVSRRSRRPAARRTAAAGSAGARVRRPRARPSAVCFASAARRLASSGPRRAA